MKRQVFRLELSRNKLLSFGCPIFNLIDGFFQKFLLTLTVD